MSKVDLTIFEELSEEVECELNEFVYHLANGCYDNNNNEYLESSGYEYLDGESSGEGGAEYCYGVFRLKGIVYKAEYSYYSYEGHNYDGIVHTLKIVKPVEKTIIVWEAEDE